MRDDGRQCRFPVEASRGLWQLCLLSALAVAAGCSEGFTVGDAGGEVGVDGSADVALRDAGEDVPGEDTMTSDAGMLDVALADAQGTDAPFRDAGRPDIPSPVCEERRLPCLPPDTEGLVEVTTYEHIQNASAGDLLQVRGLRLGRTRLPEYTTLRGCEGAEITGTLTFNGGRGLVEGFIVSGAIVGNQTGDYTVRDNEFRCSDAEGCLEASANDGILGHQVTMVVERNRFTGGMLGIVSSTRYDNMSRTVDIQIRNNIFDGVVTPIRLSESGLTGAIDALVEFNTFVGFGVAIDIFGVDSLPTLRGNLFVNGETGVRSNVPYSAPFNMGWGLTTPTTMTRPISGGITEIPASFADGMGFRLQPTSLAVDAAGSTSPPDDFARCQRPLGGGADVGAHESY